MWSARAPWRGPHLRWLVDPGQEDGWRVARPAANRREARRSSGSASNCTWAPCRSQKRGEEGPRLLLHRLRLEELRARPGQFRVGPRGVGARTEFLLGQHLHRLVEGLPTRHIRLCRCHRLPGHGHIQKVTARCGRHLQPGQLHFRARFMLRGARLVHRGPPQSEIHRLPGKQCARLGVPEAGPGIRAEPDLRSKGRSTRARKCLQPGSRWRGWPDRRDSTGEGKKCAPAPRRTARSPACSSAARTAA